MSKKPRKIEESAAPYAAKKPAGKAPARSVSSPEARPIRYIDPVTARKLTAEILDKHHELFRRLAQ